MVALHSKDNELSCAKTRVAVSNMLISKIDIVVILLIAVSLVAT